MELANLVYPLRAVIRCKAKQQLMTNLDGTGLEEQLDESLLREISQTLFQSERCDAIYEPYATREAATAVEDWAALEIAAIYQRIIQQRQSPTVQSLNALL
ncbi:hypothetical protein OsccyDRAFT_1744 [Leptolyngbyaceae cyanobacterium JSC-12]|nr:hypothetical protein OsccyDRAFT_1744 [Leptolyngbyaceae cyanobacterium JSC-12]